MHFRLELILPPTENLEADIKTILGSWAEEYEDEYGNNNDHAFYDYYVIGGRFSGSKIETLLGESRIKKFRETLAEKKVTVSNLQFGKQTISPSSQISLVDKLWNEHFPDSPVKTCVLFDHYKENFGDIMNLKDIPEELTAERVVIAGYDYKEKLDIRYMLARSLWNGSRHQDTQWDGKISSALRDYDKYLSRANEEHRKKQLPNRDWLCVTIDCHV
jgi:hypothetical protein